MSLEKATTHADFGSLLLLKLAQMFHTHLGSLVSSIMSSLITKNMMKIYSQEC